MFGFNLNEYKLEDGSIQAYAWPGGYPLFFICSDGGVLCPKCVKQELARIEESIRENYSDGWRVEAAEVNWEDASLFCDNCNKRIESAYAEDEAVKNS